MDLHELIERQFNFINLGIDHLKDDDISFEIYEYIIEFFNNNIIEFDHYQQLCNDPERLKIVAKSLYRILIVDIPYILKRLISKDEPNVNSFIDYLKNRIYDLRSLSDYMENSNQVDSELVLTSIVLDYIQTDIQSFTENYWNIVTGLKSFSLE